jgi:predicted transcriptional regulator
MGRTGRAQGERPAGLSAPISVHLPADLLAAVDARARRLGLSRSGYITEALRRDAEPAGGWSPGFLSALRSVDDDRFGAGDELAAALRRRRSRKAAPVL